MGLLLAFQESVQLSSCGVQDICDWHVYDKEVTSFNGTQMQT